ncbi:MAG: NmrA family NAD(P)-binding protein [Nitrospirae bacterium]|nr:NmrA family NAD(P)-binding protein [Nitrospirota bacterium]
MENFGTFARPSAEGVLVLPLRPDTKMQMIAVRDIGEFGVAAFLRPAEFIGQDIDLAGDELTMPETAQILGEAIGKTVSFVPTPIEEVRKFSADFASMLEWFDRVGYDVDIAGNAKTYGIQPVTLAEWVAEAM